MPDPTVETQESARIVKAAKKQVELGSYLAHLREIRDRVDKKAAGDDGEIYFRRGEFTTREGEGNYVQDAEWRRIKNTVSRAIDREVATIENRIIETGRSKR